MRITKIIVVLFTVCIFGLTACLPMFSSKLSPPSTEYNADIIGKVTVITDVLIKDGTRVQNPNYAMGGRIWVVQVAVRNKEYEIPVSFNSGNWLISFDTEKDTVGSIPQWADINNAVVQQGQEGQAFLIFAVNSAVSPQGAPVEVVPSASKIRYLGKTPTQNGGTFQVDSYGELEYTGASAAVYDFDSRRVVESVTQDSGKTTPQSNSQVKILQSNDISWETELKSATWRGNKVTVSLAVTNNGNKPADFPHDYHDPLGVSVDFAVYDSYGIWYFPDGEELFDVSKIYPGETRVFKPSFTVNSRSGEVGLFVTWYYGSKKAHLFSLGEPK